MSDLLVLLDEFSERHAAQVTIHRVVNSQSFFWSVAIKFGGIAVAHARNDKLELAIERALAEAGAL